MNCPICNSTNVLKQPALFDPCGDQDTYYQCQCCGFEWFSDEKEEQHEPI